MSPSTGGRLGKYVALDHGFAEVNGVGLHYAEAGAGELILFLHGFPEFWYAWRRQLAELGRERRAVAVDMRGYNLSSRPPEVEAYAMPHLVEDVRALVDHLGHQRFTLVGHDWGGVVAWSFASAHPDRLAGLVIVNAPHPAVFRRELRENPAQRRASAYTLLFQLPGIEAVLSAFGHALLVRAVLREGLDRGYFSEEDRRAYLEAWRRPGALRGGLNYYRAARILRGRGDAGGRGNAGGRGGAMGRGDAVIGAGESKVPTLVLWGERDRYLLPGNLEGLERHVRDLTVRRVPDAGHWIVHERPDLVTSSIRRFADECRGA